MDFFEGARGAPNECAALRWLHVKGKAPSPAQEERQIVRDTYNVQAVSPPFIDGGGVRFEQWWWGYPKEQTLHDIRYMEREYPGDAIFFEFMQYWLRNDLVDSVAKAELRAHLVRLPVCRCKPNV